MPAPTRKNALEIDLVGIAELEERYDISPHTVNHGVTKGTFPEPSARIGDYRVWLREVIENYVEERAQKRVEEARRALAPLPEATRQKLIDQILR